MSDEPRTLEVTIDGVLYYQTVYHPVMGLRYSKPEVGFAIYIAPVEPEAPK